MAAISVSEPSLSALKKALRQDFPEVKSSHLSEAIAYALGFNTYAALLAAKDATASKQRLLDENRFSQRLTLFGYPPGKGIDFEKFSGAKGLTASTVSPSGRSIKYKSDRSKAWRNLMVCAVNAGLEKQLFTLIANDNRWPGALPQSPEETRANGADAVFYDFVLPNGLPAKAYVRDIGWGELSVHVAVHPTGNSLESYNAGFSAGDAFAAGWLERKKGVWLQTSVDSFCCRSSLKPQLAALEVTPLGYGDKGGVIM